jgi:hypothetical protein
MWFQQGPNTATNVSFSNFVAQCGQGAAAISILGAPQNFANAGDKVKRNRPL